MVDKGHEAQLVDDQQPEAGQLPLQVEQPTVVPGLHQFVDQGGGGGEAHGHSPLAGGQAQAQGDVGLAGAAVADGDDVLLCSMYSHRASSMTSGLFTEGMARKSKVSRLLTAGKRAARIRRSTMRWWRSMSSSSERRSR